MTALTIRTMNIRKAKKILSSAQGDEPCLCGHPQRSHLGEELDLCLGCYAGDPLAMKFRHHFKLDNLTYIEKLDAQRYLDKIKKHMEKFKNEP